MKVFLTNIFVLTLTLFVSQSFIVHCTPSFSVRRQYHDGILYEDYSVDSTSIRYSISNGEGWDNLETLVKANYMEQKAMFCSLGPGVWLLYQDDSFSLNSKKSLKLIYGEMCVPVDNVNSVQPVGSTKLNINDMSSAVTFTEKFFASSGHTVLNDTQSPGIKSAIFLGDGNWTVDTGGENKICITTFGMDGDVCLLEDTESAFSTSTLSIQKECDDEGEMELYGLQSCYSTGYREMIYETEFTANGMQQMCSAGGYDSNDPVKDKFLNVMKIWNFRMGLSNPRFRRTELADLRFKIIREVLDIGKKSCLNLNNGYISVVEEIYIALHLDYGNIWNEDPTSGLSLHELRELLTSVVLFLRNCNANINKGEGSFINQNCMGPDSPVDEENLETVEDFLNGESYDFVIEQIYLIFSYVSTVCFNLVGTLDNTWTGLPILFKKDFLFNLREQWKNPGKWVDYYPIMFNGFDLEEKRKNIISCLIKLIQRSTFYDPLERPPEFSDGKNNVTIADIIKKPDDKKKESRRKRQWRLSEESDDDYLIENELIENNLPKQKKPKSIRRLPSVKKPTTSSAPSIQGVTTPVPIPKKPSQTTAIPKITKSTTSSTTNTDTSSTTDMTQTISTKIDAIDTLTSTSGPESDTERSVSKARKHGKKKKSKHGKKQRRNKKHSKLRRKKTENTSLINDQIERTETNH